MKIKMRGIGKVLTGMFFFSVLGKVLGFFREVMLSYFYGATGISDAYLISQVIPGTIFQVVGIGLTTCYIPIYYKLFNEKGKSAVDHFTDKILWLIFLLSTAVIGIVYMNTSVIVKLFASGFSGDTLQYAILFTRIGILSLYFSTIIYVYNCYLQANNVFMPTVLAAIPNSLFIMLSIYLSTKMDVIVLSIGSTLAVAVQLVFLYFPIRKLKYKIHFNIGFKDEAVREFFILMIPVVIGVSVSEINTLVDRTLASKIAVGGISALTYANSLVMFIQGGIAQPIATVCYPKIANAVSEHYLEDAKMFTQKVIQGMIVILVPITFGFILYSKAITILLFGHGAFDENAVDITSKAVQFYAIGIVFLGIREILSRCFYAFSDTKTPMKNATIGVTVNIVLNIVFSKMLGIEGLAFATSVATILTMILLKIDCKKIFTEQKLQFDYVEIGKVVLASAVMAIGSYEVFQIVGGGIFMQLCLAVMSGIIIYFLVGLILKIELIGLIGQMAIKKILIK